MFKKLTRSSVLKAIAEYDRLGSEEFLRTHGFGKARRYHLMHEGKSYDSKAIVGGAYAIQFKRRITPSDFNGGIKTIVPTLDRLKFLVVADAIKDSQVALPEEAGAIDLWEGAQQKILVNRYERSTEARAECIQHHGVQCCICGFDFGATYGDRFKGFIHVHHLVPLSRSRRAHKVNAKKDLRPVCPNCHAVIHYGGKTNSIDRIKKLLTKRS